MDFNQNFFVVLLIKVLSTKALSACLELEATH